MNDIPPFFIAMVVMAAALVTFTIIVFLYAIGLAIHDAIWEPKEEKVRREIVESMNNYLTELRELQIVQGTYVEPKEKSWWQKLIIGANRRWGE